MKTIKWFKFFPVNDSLRKFKLTGKLILRPDVYLALTLIVLITLPVSCARNDLWDKLSDDEMSEEYFDSFDSGLNASFFNWHASYPLPFVSGGKMVLPIPGVLHYSILLTKKFKLPFIVEGTIRISDTTLSYCSFNIDRRPADYQADCTPRAFYIYSRWENNFYNTGMSYNSDPVTIAADELVTVYPENTVIDFRFEVYRNIQKIFINGTLLQQWSTPMADSYWWVVHFSVSDPANTSEIEWLRIVTPEFGDFETPY